MPTIVWLAAGTAVWLAAVGALYALLRVAKRADAALGADPNARGPRCLTLPALDAAGLLEPSIRAIVADVREPGRAGCGSGPGRRRLQRSPEPSEVDRSRWGSSYALHVHNSIVARLCWRADSDEPAGWYLRQRCGGWRRLAIDAESEAGGGLSTRHPARRHAAERAACVSTALALDAAGDLLRGPPALPARPLRPARYEVHATGLACDIGTTAFPEAVTVRVGHTTVLTGHFDDRALTVLTRRIAILGGHVLAVVRAAEPHASHAIC